MIMSLTFKLTESPPQPSISVVQLNNTLVKMRKVIKAAKVYASRHLLRYIRIIRVKLNKDPTNLRLKHKLDHRLSELRTLRHLSVVRLCKLVLANEHSRNELSAVGHKLLEQDRLIIRLSAEKPVAQFVREFREAHPDWRSLVHYLLYKNISGKWKSREQKKRNRTVRGALPLPPTTADISRLEESSGDDTKPTEKTMYRVPVLNVSDVDEAPHQESLVNCNIDSDAASDIADEVVRRVLTKKKHPKKPKPRAVSVNYLTATNTPLVESNDEVVQDTFRHVIATEPNDINSGRQKKRRAKHRTIKTSYPSEGSESTKRTITSSKLESDPLPVFPPVVVADVADDEDPLGSDDVVMRSKLTRKFRRRGPSPFFGSRSYQNHTTPEEKKSRTSDTSSSAVSKQPIRRSFPKGKPKPTTDSMLHPSWQAKREQKLKTKLPSLNPAPTAKHIIFDD